VVIQRVTEYDATAKAASDKAVSHSGINDRLQRCIARSVKAGGQSGRRNRWKNAQISSVASMSNVVGPTIEPIALLKSLPGHE